MQSATLDCGMQMLLSVGMPTVIQVQYYKVQTIYTLIMHALMGNVTMSVLPTHLCTARCHARQGRRLLDAFRRCHQVPVLLVQLLAHWMYMPMQQNSSL